MGKRLFLVALLAGAMLACKGTGKSDRQSKMALGATASASGQARDAVERALMRLGIDGRILRIDLNEGRAKRDRVHIARLHLLNSLLILETSEKQPRLFALSRNGLDPRWVSSVSEPTRFPAAESSGTIVLVSAHYAHALERVSGRRALQFIGGELDGVRRPALDLPFSPTGGAAVGEDTFYVPSLGSPENNKNIEAFSAITGQRGWGYRASGEILTTPLIGGGTDDPKLYFITTTGLITCLDATNYGYAPRGPRWEHLLDAGSRFGLFVTADNRQRPGSVFAVDDEGVVYCLNRITGQRRWTSATGRRPAAAPEVFGNLCVVRMKSGLVGFHADNVVYALEVESGPDAGQTFWVWGGGGASTLGSGEKDDLGLSDKSVGASAVTLELQGEVLVASSPDGSAVMRLDGGAPTARATLLSGSRLAIGKTVLRVRDHGDDPLWADVDADRVIGRVGDTLLVLKGRTLRTLNAWTGETQGEAVELPAARLIPANSGDAALYVVAGDAIIYALFPR